MLGESPFCLCLAAVVTVTVLIMSTGDGGDGAVNSTDEPGGTLYAGGAALDLTRVAVWVLEEDRPHRVRERADLPAGLVRVLALSDRDAQPSAEWFTADRADLPLGVAALDTTAETAFGPAAYAALVSLEHLADDPAAYEAATGMSAARLVQLVGMANDHAPRVMGMFPSTLVASTKPVPPWLLSRLFKARPDLGLAIAQNPFADASLLTRLANNIASREAEAVAENPSTPTDVLYALASGPPRVVTALARNPRAPSELLARLVALEDGSRVHWQLARNPATPRELLGRWLLEAGDLSGPASTNPSTPAEALADAAVHAKVRVRGTAARHPNTPTELLARLVADPDDTVALSAAANPSTPSDALAAAYIQLRDDPHRDAYRWDQLPRHLARNPTTPLTVLEELATLPGRTLVRIDLLRNRACPVGLRTQIARQIRAELGEPPRWEEDEKAAQHHLDTLSALAQYAPDEQLLADLAGTNPPASRITEAIAHNVEAPLSVLERCAWRVLPPDRQDHVVRARRPRAGQLPALFDRLLSSPDAPAGRAVDVALAATS